MITRIAKAVFGSKNDRVLKRMGKVVRQINDLEESFQALRDAELQAKTDEFKRRLAAGETLDQLLPEAFAAVREASRRTLGLRHFDVQLIGGIALHEGCISEMRTGEGKTLVATLAVYLNALTDRGVHIVTVNDYLARRDAAWMAPIYEFLGMTVGAILPGQDLAKKREAYAADITYGTNNEFGFDYLRDNMVLRLEDRVQRDLHFAIVDEVDSILIDEARTPLIISGQAEDSSELYRTIDKLVRQLQPHIEAVEGEVEQEGHFVLDEKSRQVELTENGHELVEDLLAKQGLLEAGESLYSATNLKLLHHVHTALRAQHLFHRDAEYIVQNGQIVLIDEHTGRTMAGRRLSEGLHQAIEAKEGVAIQSESQTMASTTFQNYFRLYEKLAGMTGTADTEAFEFQQIYGLDVVVIPTNKPLRRLDLNDLIYLNKVDKYEAIIADIKACQEKNAPVLVGTITIDTSEELSKQLDKAKIPHQVLNAKYHDKEAEIIAQAGRPGAVTIATNMAGRGTDIVLGGNWEAEVAKLENPTDEQIEQIKAEWKQRNEQVLEAGGLHIIGTERHESRRIDNQLRGRAGRQGDPGLSRFYLSLDDNLMRLFASDRVRSMMQALGMEKGEAIEHRMVSNAIEKAQRKVEGRNFDIRKQLLDFDNVANEQRQIIYQQRSELLEEDDISETIDNIRGDVVAEMVHGFVPPQSLEEQWDLAGLEQMLRAEFGLTIPVKQWADDDETLQEAAITQRVIEAVDKAYREKRERIGTEQMKSIEKQVMLQVLDTQWKEQLANMDHLRQAIGLRAYAQRNPKQEYKREAFNLFQQMLDSLKHEVIRILARIELMSPEDAEALERQRLEQQQKQKMQFQHAQMSALQEEQQAGDGEGQAQTFKREGRKVGRNEPCPCGSGKKYKQCCGKLAS